MISLFLALGTYVLFDRLLGMQLPGGILERILWGKIYFFDNIVARLFHPSGQKTAEEPKPT